MQELNGQVAVITGGASGIGLALAYRFAEAGMAVAVGDVEELALDVAVEELRAREPTSTEPSSMSPTSSQWAASPPGQLMHSVHPTWSA